MLLVLILRIFVLQKLQDKCEVQGRNLASLEERCASLKSTIDQLNLALERANTGEAEMRAEIQSLQRTLLDTSTTSQSSSEKLKQVSCSFCGSAERFSHVHSLVSSRITQAFHTGKPNSSVKNLNLYYDL
jgi:rootletin